MKIATIVLLVINALLLAANIGIQVAIVKYEVEDLKVQTVVNHALQAEIQDLQDRVKVLEQGNTATWDGQTQLNVSGVASR